MSMTPADLFLVCSSTRVPSLEASFHAQKEGNDKALTMIVDFMTCYAYSDLCASLACGDSIPAYVRSLAADVSQPSKVPGLSQARYSVSPLSAQGLRYLMKVYSTP
jgi:hypothetical protein